MNGMWYVCPPVLLCMEECADACTPWQVQRTPLHYASKYGNAGAVQVLVDSKANMEAHDELAMWPVQPGVCHTFGGGVDAGEGGAAV